MVRRTRRAEKLAGGGGVGYADLWSSAAAARRSPIDPRRRSAQIGRREALEHTSHQKFIFKLALGHVLQRKIEWRTYGFFVGQGKRLLVMLTNAYYVMLANVY